MTFTAPHVQSPVSWETRTEALRVGGVVMDEHADDYSADALAYGLARKWARLDTNTGILLPGQHSPWDDDVPFFIDPDPTDYNERRPDTDHGELDYGNIGDFRYWDHVYSIPDVCDRINGGYRAVLDALYLSWWVWHTDPPSEHTVYASRFCTRVGIVFALDEQWIANAPVHRHDGYDRGTINPFTRSDGES